MYRKLFFEKITYVLLIIDAFALVMDGLFQYNPIRRIRVPSVEKGIYLLVLFAAFYNISRRNYYLPFLGNCVFPCNALRPSNPSNATMELVLQNLTPNTNVVFWASEKKDSHDTNEVVETPWDAYDAMANKGIAISDAKGKATIKIRTPVAYKVPSGRTLQQHVHYRECVGNGMLGPVQTKYV